MLAARNILGEAHDLWNVNVERSYHEDFTNKEWASLRSSSSNYKPRAKVLEAFS
jgi:hypothetical protein